MQTTAQLAHVPKASVESTALRCALSVSPVSIAHIWKIAAC